MKHFSPVSIVCILMVNTLGTSDEVKFGGNLDVWSVTEEKHAWSITEEKAYIPQA